MKSILGYGHLVRYVTRSTTPSASTNAPCPSLDLGGSCGSDYADDDDSFQIDLEALKTVTRARSHFEKWLHDFAGRRVTAGRDSREMKEENCPSRVPNQAKNNSRDETTYPGRTCTFDRGWNLLSCDHNRVLGSAHNLGS